MNIKSGVMIRYMIIFMVSTVLLFLAYLGAIILLNSGKEITGADLLHEWGDWAIFSAIVTTLIVVMPNVIYYTRKKMHEST